MTLMEVLAHHSFVRMGVDRQGSGTIVFIEQWMGENNRMLSCKVFGTDFSEAFAHLVAEFGSAFPDGAVS
jgi:hypothetical protein